MIRNRVPPSQIIEMLRAGARAAVDAVSDLAVAELKEMTGIQGPPRSLPDQPPHMDSGALNESMQKKLISNSGSEAAVIGEDTPYALAQEFGYAPNNLAPRPHQRVEMQRVQDDARFTELAAQKIREAMRI
mgnify:CR=1 FL=1